MYKVVDGYLIDKDVLVLENGSYPAEMNNLKIVRVIVDEECVKQWNDELRLGVTDNWEEAE